MIKKSSNKTPIFFLMGHTASGKTNLSFILKDKFPNIEIISVDSTLIFREMNIGTAKPNYKELIKYPHKLINIRDPIQKYSVFDFYRDSLIHISEIIKNKKIPLLVGGSMFYFKILLNGINYYPTLFINLEIKNYINNYFKEEKYNYLYKKINVLNLNNFNNIHINDNRRIYKSIKLFLLYENKKIENLYKTIKNYGRIYQFFIYYKDKKLINKKIKYRFYKMLENGFENEVINLYNRGDLNSNMQSIKSIGYNQMWSFLSNKISYIDMINKSILSTNTLMKKQITWIKNWKFNVIKYDNSISSINKLINFVYKKINN